MINSVAKDAQAVNVGGYVTFTSDRVRTRSSRYPDRGWLGHSVNSDTFTLTKPGIYKVAYNADIVLNAGTGEISLAIEADGVIIDGSTSTHNSTVANAKGGISATSLIVVCPCQYVNIKLVNNSTSDGTVTNANIIIDKVA